ncbi:MAG: FAD-dependent oxidoreductase, partial [Candidatus Bathyarchaeota archaeon]|nr:FAD-dependent oxidoreductase [Candidatus Bathyarchaeota archaeon]
QAINHQQQPQEITLNIGAIIVATGFDLFDASQIPHFGYKRYKDVITSIELERLLCASGPTGGKLVKPSDGRVPRSIAFIQCVGSRDRREWINNPYCSSICCKYAVKDAVLVKEHIPNAQVTIFYIDMRAFGRGFQEFVNRAKTEYGINFVRSNPGTIIENPETKELTIWFEDTATRTVKNLTFDLIVLCPALIPKNGSAELAKILGIETDKYGFFKSPDPVTLPVDTTIPGIFACGYCLGPKTGDIPDSVTQASATAVRVAEVLAEVRKK